MQMRSERIRIGPMPVGFRTPNLDHTPNAVLEALQLCCGNQLPYWSKGPVSPPSERPNAACKMSMSSKQRYLNVQNPETSTDPIPGSAGDHGIRADYDALQRGAGAYAIPG